MAEFRGTQESSNQHDSLESTIPLNRHDFIDLTETDDLPTSRSSVASYDSSGTETAMQSSSGKRTVRDSETLDDSVSIVYENIKPQPDLQIVELSDVTDNIVEQLLKDTNYGHISRKIKVGSKSVNLSVSISTKKTTAESTSEVNIANRKDPEVQEIQSPVTKPCTSMGIECGICFDSVDEISASGRKLISTVCGHVFCCTCFAASMKVAKVCPNCRKKLTSKQFHPLYL